MQTVINILNNTLSYLQEFNLISIIVRLFLAVILGGIIGIERSKSGRAAGLRTHILVCLGAAIASMTGLYINMVNGGTGDVTRIAAQVISGIGFLGAGTILIKNKDTVVGLTTAAGVWVVGSIGIALGYGFYLAAALGALLVFFITHNLGFLDKKLRKDRLEFGIYVEFVDSRCMNQTLKEMDTDDVVLNKITLVKPKTMSADGVGAEMIIHVSRHTKITDVIDTFNALENIKFAILTEK